MLSRSSSDVMSGSMQSPLSLHTEYSGKRFNKYYNSLYKDAIFYKFLNNNLKHYEFEYKLGLNIDSKQFNPSGECSIGGLYFCDEASCYHHFDTYGTKLALIEIPNDARVYVEENKFKADKIFITKIIDFRDVDNDFWINIIHKNGYAIKYVKKQTPEICTLAVQQNGFALRFVQNQTASSLLEIYIQAVQQNGYSIIHIREAASLIPYEICYQAVKQNGLVLQFVKNRSILESKSLSKEIHTTAVQQNGLALQYVPFAYRTKKICDLAVKQNGLALQFVIDKYKTEELCSLAIQQNVKASKYKIRVTK